MLELVKKELRKVDLKYHIYTFLFVNLILFFITIGTVELFNRFLNFSLNYPDTINLISKPTFIIWESVLAVQIILYEFRNKTILVMYTYKYAKKELIGAKIILVTMISAIGITLFQITQNVILFLLSATTKLIAYEISVAQLVMIVVSIFLILLIGFLPLAVGLIKYSVLATMVSSIAIVSIGTTTGVNMNQLLGQIPFLIILGLLGLIGLIVVVRNILMNDLIIK